MSDVRPLRASAKAWGPERVGTESTQGNYEQVNRARAQSGRILYSCLRVRVLPFPATLPRTVRVLFVCFLGFSFF